MLLNELLQSVGVIDLGNQNIDETTNDKTLVIILAEETDTFSSTLSPL